MRSLAKNLALAAASCITFLLLLEGGLRIARLDLAVPALDVRQARDSLSAPFRTEHFIADPELFWTGRPSFPPFNERGYRGDLVAIPKPAGELRILAMGDSNTLGHAHSWTNQLAETLDPRVYGRERVTVVNGAVYGYTSYQGRLRLERFARYQPDLLLISFGGGNDSGLHVAPDNALNPGRWQRWLERAARRLRTAALVRYLAYRLQRARSDRPAPSSGVPRVSVEDYRANLKAMIARGRQIGARPVLLTRPFAYDVYAAPGNSLGAYYKATFETGAVEGVPVIDVHRMMGCHWALYSDYSHFNGRGHASAATLVSRALEQIQRDGRYDAEALRYRPADTAYEGLLDVLRTTTSLWVAPQAVRAAVREAAGTQARRTVFDLPASAGTGWKPETPQHVLSSGGGMLCLSTASGPANMVMDLAPDGQSHLFVWLELDGRVEAAAMLGWDTGQGFPEDQAVSDAFSGPPAQRPYRLNHLLPRGVRRLRIGLLPLGRREPVCLQGLWVEAIAAN